VISPDTNVLFHATNAHSPAHKAARAFVEALSQRRDVAVSELVLTELYVLLRNPAVVPNPASAADAVKVVESFRRHPHWRLVDHDPAVMSDVWARCLEPAFARTRIFDTRLALGLVRHGVEEFATSNFRHFQGFGFRRVFDPLVPDAE
jgi:toxin-antitoxin system PIN domain toxin